jgi:exopolysaccharide biosynthesis polyprenyl glycosylphosphotransferase
VSVRSVPALPSIAEPLEGLAGFYDERAFKLVEGTARSTRAAGRGWLMRRMLLAADVFGLLTAFLLAQIVFAAHTADGSVTAMSEYLILLCLPLWIVLAKLYGLYDRDEERTAHSTMDDMVGVFHLVTVGVWIVFAASFLTAGANPEVAKLISFWALAIAAIAGARSVARAACRRHAAYIQNTIIVGAGEVGQLVAQKMFNHPEYGLRVLGFVDDRPLARRENLDNYDLTILGAPERLPELVGRLHVDRVVIAFSNDSHEETLGLIRSLRDHDVQIDIVPRMFEVVGANVGLHTVEGLPLIGLPPLRLSRSSRAAKRAIDVVIGSLSLILLAPVFAAIAAWIRIDSPGAAFFRQERVGAGDETFRIFKFRTMTTDAEQRKDEVAHLSMHAKGGGDPRMFKIPDDPRVTRAGRFLRRFSLDELPQLINVVKGDMSLVGPRPLIHDEDRFVAAWARRRLDLKPGVTGLWQVLGASDIPFEEMTKLDYLYVTNWSIPGDLRLVFQTLPALVRTRNAY